MDRSLKVAQRLNKVAIDLVIEERNRCVKLCKEVLAHDLELPSRAIQALDLIAKIRGGYEPEKRG